MMSTLKFWKRLLLAPILPMYFGGDSESDSSTNTTNKTDNYAQSIDKRAVASDAAVSLTGDGNAVDRSTTTNSTTSMVDSSNRSSSTITQMFDKSSRDNSTHFADSSVKDYSTVFNDNSVKDSSTRFTDGSTKTTTTRDSGNTSMVDSSNRSVNYSSTDYGSVGKALDSLGMMSSKALDVAAGGVNGSIDALKYIADLNQKSVSAAFDMAKSSGANSLKNSADVLGFATTALAKTEAALVDAKDGGQSKMVTYAIAAIAVVGVAFALRA